MPARDPGHAVEHIPTRRDRLVPLMANIKGGAPPKKVLDGLFNRALITTDGTDWFCHHAEAPTPWAFRVPREHTEGHRSVRNQSRPDHRQGAEGAYHRILIDPRTGNWFVTAAEPPWVKPAHSRTANKPEVIRMLQRPEGATIGQIWTATG